MTFEAEKWLRDKAQPLLKRIGVRNGMRLLDWNVRWRVNGVAVVVSALEPYHQSGAPIHAATGGGDSLT